MKLKPLALALFLLPPAAALADDTQVLPRGAFLLDVQYSRSRLDKEWGDDRKAHPLLEEIQRYEPGGGLQGVVTARPVVEYDWLITQLHYGVTDSLTAGVVVPVVLRTHVETNLGWREGDYMSQLGRPYSQEDFWQWAESMGQPRPASAWDGNRGTLADIVLALRWQLPRTGLIERLGITAAATLQGALPTGANTDPEELVASGTNGWEVHSYGDLEAHLAVKRPLWTDGTGLERVAVGVDLFYAFLRPRSFVTPRGTRNPLLLNYQPYVGDSYVIDGGDWLGATLSVDVSLIKGPTYATFASGGSLARAEQFPALVALNASYTFVSTGQSVWRSDSPLWSWEREKHWRPGDKNVFRANLLVSLLRLGLPLQLYGAVRAQEILPGRNTRPALVLGGGVRLLGKFW
ncbi:MAG: hypothetical protein ACYC8T_04015 [Myxococcaceae bacterium]